MCPFECVLRPSCKTWAWAEVSGSRRILFMKPEKQGAYIPHIYLQYLYSHLKLFLLQVLANGCIECKKIETQNLFSLSKLQGEELVVVEPRDLTFGPRLIQVVVGRVDLGNFVFQSLAAPQDWTRPSWGNHIIISSKTATMKGLGDWPNQNLYQYKYSEIPAAKGAALQPDPFRNSDSSPEATAEAYRSCQSWTSCTCPKHLWSQGNYKASKLLVFRSRPCKLSYIYIYTYVYI